MQLPHFWKAVVHGAGTTERGVFPQKVVSIILKAPHPPHPDLCAYSLTVYHLNPTLGTL